MQYFFIPLFLFFLISDNMLGQTQTTDYLQAEVSDSSSNNNSINFLKVGGQILTGAASGTIFSLPFYSFSLIAGGIGWLVGSSLGVYLIGNIGEQNGNYWGTLSGGAIGSTLFILTFSNSKTVDGYGLYLGALLTSIPFEVLSYYLFRSNDKSSNMFINSRSGFINNSGSNTRSNEILTKPDIYFPLINISF